MVGEQLLEPTERFNEWSLFVAGKLNQQQRFRRALDISIERGSESWYLARQVHHRSVHKLDSRRRQLDDKARQPHRIVKAIEVTDRTHPVLRNAMEPELYLREKAERSLRPNHQL